METRERPTSRSCDQSLGSDAALPSTSEALASVQRLIKHECRMRLAHPDHNTAVGTPPQADASCTDGRGTKVAATTWARAPPDTTQPMFSLRHKTFLRREIFERDTKGQHIIDKVWHDYRLHLDQCHKNIWRTRQVSPSRSGPMQWLPRLLFRCCGCSKRQRPIRLVNISFLLHGVAKI